jgi:phage baseplate assembly protein W
MDDNIRNREFLGQGLAFPLQINSQGEIALASGERDIEQAIKIILETEPGERVMRPEFGCRVHELVFAPHNAATEGMLIHYVEEALARWEPRVEVQAVDVAADARGAALWVEIKYQVKATHDERSIVYPFYLMGEEEPVSW